MRQHLVHDGAVGRVVVVESDQVQQGRSQVDLVDVGAGPAGLRHRARGVRIRRLVAVRRLRAVDAPPGDTGPGEGPPGDVDVRRVVAVVPGERAVDRYVGTAGGEEVVRYREQRVRR